ncbi:MAG: glycosyltransferase, partial [Bryobacteraceae bacterium]|nr:glycosyltransferase [Bryobacteraceae bacterium]
RLQAELEQTRTERDISRGEAQLSQEDLAESLRTRRDIEQVVHELSVQVRLHEQENAAIRKAFSQQTASLAGLQNELEQTQIISLNLRSTNEDLQTFRFRSVEALNRVMAERDELVRENLEFQHNRVIEGEKSRADQNALALLVAVAESRPEPASLTQRLKSLGVDDLPRGLSKLAKLYTEMSVEQQNSAATVKKVHVLEHRVHNLQTAVKAAHWQVATLERQLAERPDGSRELQEEAHTAAIVRYVHGSSERIRTLQDRLHALRQTASEQAKLIDVFRTQLGNVVTSLSWKLTAPVRALGDGGLTVEGVASAPILPPLSDMNVPAVSTQEWIDEATYLAAFPDVADAVRNGAFSSGLEHWLLKGWNEICTGERADYRTAKKNPLRSNHPTFLPSRAYVDVLYIIGCHDGESKRYRVHNLMEFFSEQGYSSVAFSEHDIPSIISAGIQCHALVIFRAAYNDHIASVIRYARNRGIQVVFDVDDLIFEPHNIDYIRVLSTFTPEQVAGYRSDLERYRRVLLESDLFTCTTGFLAERARELGKRAAVIPNSINARQMELAEALNSRERWSESHIRIGYFSGSNTHQVDFESCEPALRQVMARYPECRFVLVGILDLGPEWSPFASRVERHPMVPYTEMLELLAGCNINLAPLEVGNPYCESKSQLKIFEAGLVYVPTVASAVHSYGEAIDHGVDGFLARTTAEWLGALQLLIESPELRRRTGNAARERAIQQFGLEPVGRLAIQAYGLDKIHGAVSTEGKADDNSSQTPWRRLKIAWIVPGLIIGGGGHRNILRAAYHLQRFGHELELYFTDVTMDSDSLRRTVHEHFYPIQCPMHRYEGQIGAADVLFATHWTTVSPALKARANVGEVMYFVQDFEPLFAPMGTEYVLAENTYRQGLYCITSGPWCEHILRRDFQLEADHFQLPVDKSVYYPRPRLSTGPNVVFFAKPEMPRRCYEIGLMALDHLHRRRPDVEIILYGSRSLEGRSFPFPATVRSIVPTIDDLAKMYSDADAGIVFSTTNPSLVPYEMMASGLPVVDMNRGGNEANYGNRYDVALLADPSPEVMAFQICELLSNPVELAARSRAGIQLVRQFPSEEEMAERVQELILRRVARGADAAVQPTVLAQLA